MPTRVRRLLSLLWLMIAACDDGPPPAGERVRPAPAPEGGALVALGTGAMTDLVRDLAAAYRARGGSPAIEVEASVGSGGGIRAVRDGAVSIGLTSRPLRDAEAAELLRAPIALDGVVIAAHPGPPRTSLAADELARIVRGDADEGERLVVFLRDREESANAALESAFPVVRPAREEAYRLRRHRVLFHDDAMREALVRTPSSMGVLSLATALRERPPLVPLVIDGKVPTLAAVEDGSWPAVRELSLVFRAETEPALRGFLAFVRSKEGGELVRAAGFVPRQGSEP
jgi:phosphate transport system substrate-binding protein